MTQQLFTELPASCLQKLVLAESLGQSDSGTMLIIITSSSPEPAFDCAVFGVRMLLFGALSLRYLVGEPWAVPTCVMVWQEAKGSLNGDEPKGMAIPPTLVCA